MTKRKSQPIRPTDPKERGIEGTKSEVLRIKTITTARRNDHTTNPHQSKRGSRKTDDR